MVQGLFLHQTLLTKKHCYVDRINKQSLMCTLFCVQRIMEFKKNTPYFNMILERFKTMLQTVSSLGLTLIL